MRWFCKDFVTFTGNLSNIMIIYHILNILWYLHFRMIKKYKCSLPTNWPVIDLSTNQMVWSLLHHEQQAKRWCHIDYPNQTFIKLDIFDKRRALYSILNEASKNMRALNKIMLLIGWLIRIRARGLLSIPGLKLFRNLQAQEFLIFVQWGWEILGNLNTEPIL